MLSADHPENLRNLLRSLMNIYSPTGKEQEILGFLYKYLKSGGLPVKQQKIDKDRANLIVIPPRRIFWLSW